MCRLYGFHSTAPRKVECELIASQNSLISQSRSDETGGSHPHGWGLVTYYDGDPHADRQLEPAFKSDRFRWSAGHAYSKTVLAHVRKATVGAVTIENTHPFVSGRFSFVHNGTIGAFTRIREMILDEIGQEQATKIKGSTDSEHFFHLLLSRNESRDLPMMDILGECCGLVLDWVTKEDRTAEIAFNTIWTDGETMVGSRFGRSLWYTHRDEAHTCEICGTNHTLAGRDEPYRALVLASERLTAETTWIPIEEGAIFEIPPSCGIRIEKM